MSINGRKLGVVGAGVMALVASVAVTAVMLLVFAPAHPWQVLHDWIEFVPLPGLVVFTASRSGFFEKRPWLLLLLGPLAFIIAGLGLLLTHGIVFAPALLARKPNVTGDTSAWLRLPRPEWPAWNGMQKGARVFARSVRAAERP